MWLMTFYFCYCFYCSIRVYSQACWVACSLKLDFFYVTFGLHCHRRYIGLPYFLSHYSLHWSPCTIQISLKLMYDTDLVTVWVWYDLGLSLLYNIYLRATTTTILSIWGVTIPIDLVSSATDSIWWSVVLFKLVLYHPQTLSLSSCVNWVSVVQNLQTPPNTSYAWDISHTLVTTYHPYCHSPSALTEYLKQKLCHQWAKRLGCSPSAQVEQNVPLECNILLLVNPRPPLTSV